MRRQLCAAFVIPLFAGVSLARGDYLYFSINSATPGIEQATPTGEVSPVSALEALGLGPGDSGFFYAVSPVAAYKIGGGQVSEIAKNPTSFFNGIAADGRGDIFLLSNFNGGGIAKLGPNDSLTFLPVPNGLVPLAMAADPAGSLFATFVPFGSPTSDPHVYKLAPGGMFSDYLDITGPTSVATDQSGDLYVLASGSVVEVTPQNVITTLATGLQDANLVTVDPNGAVFLAETFKDASGQHMDALGQLIGGAFAPIAQLPAPSLFGNPLFGAVAGLVASPAPINVPEPGVATEFWLVAVGLAMRPRHRRVVKLR